jgi:hypothetical protein
MNLRNYPVVRALQPAGVAFFLLFLVTAFAHAQFEGIISMKISDMTDSTPRVVYYDLRVKGNLVSAEMRDNTGAKGESRFVFRGDRKILWIISDSSKSYFEVAMHDTVTAKSMVPPASPPGKPLTVTGRTDVIQGYPCDEFLVEDAGRSIHIWGTSKLANVSEGLRRAFGEMEAKSGGDAKGWEDELARKKIFPMKVVTLHDGVMEEAQEVTRVERQAIPSSLFDAPRDYERHSFDMDVQKMLEKMQGDSKEDSTDKQK